MMLTLQKYELMVSYKPGKSLFIADTLSRAPGAETATMEEEYRDSHSARLANNYTEVGAV